MSEMNSDAQDSVNNEGFDPQANPDDMVTLRSDESFPRTPTA